MEYRTLITGANRGIGLELARQYAAAGWRVFATCRSPENAPELSRLAASSAGQISIHPFEVTNAAQLRTLVSVVGRDTAIDILFNNAGVYGPKDGGFGKTDVDRWIEVTKVNAIAPMQVMEAFVDHVARSQRKMMVSITSKMGNMADNTSGGSYVYRSSKAGLNAVMKSVAIDLAPRGIIAVIMHPGWVQTDMGGPSAPTATAESVTGIRAVLDNLTLADSGRFLDFRGNEVPW